MEENKKEEKYDYIYSEYLEIESEDLDDLIFLFFEEKKHSEK